MAHQAVLPAGWSIVVDRCEHDSVMNRDYTTLVYEHPSTNQRVYVNEVQEYNTLGGWGYRIHVHGAENGELDLVEDAETAREIAHEFMNSYDS